MRTSDDNPKLTNAQRCSIRALKRLNDEVRGPFELYPGAEHNEVVFMSLHESGTRERQFLVAVGGCVSEVLR